MVWIGCGIEAGPRPLRWRFAAWTSSPEPPVSSTSSSALRLRFLPCFKPEAFAFDAFGAFGAFDFAILPAFWALVMLPRLFSSATAFAKLMVTSFPPFFSGAGRIEPPKISAVDWSTGLSCPPWYRPESLPCLLCSLYYPFLYSITRTGKRVGSVLRRNFGGIWRVTIVLSAKISDRPLFTLIIRV